MGENKVNHITRNWDGTPTIVDGVIEENCIFENALVEGWGTIIIDKEFIDSMNEITDNYEVPNDMIRTLTDISNAINRYFFSNEKNDYSRNETYSKSFVTDEEGMIIGTKLSSLKGKNIAECSEKSIAAYLILDRLFRNGKISRKPSLILSNLKTDTILEGPHAFIIISNEENKYPLKHMLFDVNNPTRISDKDNEYTVIGMYTLDDAEYDAVTKGVYCTPKSLFEVVYQGYQEISEKRTFGSKEKEKII